MQTNTVTFVGSVATDVFLTAVKDDLSLARFRMVVPHRTFDRAAAQWVDAHPTFVGVKCLGRLAQNVAHAVHKGDPVVVSGRLCVRQNERQGRRYTRVEVEAVTVGLDLARTDAVVPAASDGRAA